MPDDESPRTDRATPARIYDYLLGGANNFASDREAAERLLSVAPETRLVARQNRAFLRQAVRYLTAEAGIWQFIDLGAGLPTGGAVHEIAQAVTPGIRVVYVDNDSLVHSQAKSLLDEDGTTALIDADLREPRQVLEHPGLRRLLDLDEPVAVMFMAVLHFVTDDQDPYDIVATYRDATAPGSHMALSHATTSKSNDHATGVYTARSTSPMVTRSPKEVTAFFAGYDLVEPGVVPLSRWRGEDASKEIHEVRGHVGVGRKRAS